MCRLLTRIAWAFAALGIILAVPSAASADDPFARGIDAVPHKLGTTTDAFLTVEGSRTAPAGSWQLWLGADYGSGLLGLRYGDDHRGRLIGDRLDFHLAGSFSPTDWLELGLDVPVTVLQTNGFRALETQSGFADRAPAGAGFGDLRTLAKFRLLREDSAPVGLAAILEVRMPTGASDDFLGGRGWLFSPRAVVDKTFNDTVRVAVEAGYRMRTEAGQYLNLYVGDELGLSVAASWLLPQTLPGGQWAAFAELLTSTQARAPFNGPDSDALKTPVEGLVGLRNDLGGGFHALVGGGSGIGSGAGYGNETIRLFAGVGFRQTAEPPDPNADRDGDGVLDVDDACPNDPGPVEYDGCPDTDKDEIPDHEDDCPDEPGPAQKNGCPASDPLVIYENGKLSLNGAVNFDTGRATIKLESYDVLDEVAEVLKAHPEVKKVRIDGHTDSRGSRKFNIDLSKRRAASVVEHLVRQGVERRRLDSTGHGPDRPIASNASALGRAQNRRVEFTILE